MKKRNILIDILFTATCAIYTIIKIMYILIFVEVFSAIMALIFGVGLRTTIEIDPYIAVIYSVSILYILEKTEKFLDKVSDFLIKLTK